MYDDTSIPKPNCPPIDCKKKGDCCITTRKVLIPSIFSDEEGEYKTANGLFCDTIVEYEANGHVYIYSSDGIPTQIKSDSTDSIKLYDTTGDNTDGAMTQKATTEALDTKQNTLTAGDGVVIENDVISAASATVDPALSYISENPVQNKVITEALDGKANSSEIALLATKAELQTKADKTELDNYTTTADLNTQLALKADKTQLGNYATIADMNAGLDAKQDILTAGTNITIENNVISSTVDTSTFATKTELNDKADKSTTYTKAEVDALMDSETFVATYNVTTAQELMDYLDSTKEPFAPVLVKRGNDYYTALLSSKSSNSVTLRVLGSGSDDYIIFNYTVTGSTWASSSYSFQKKLVSGTDIKTINGESLLGSGNIEVGGGSTVTVDDALSTTSENPVQNKVITTALNGKADTADIPDVSNLATKTELTTGLATKADTTALDDYYTKTQADALLADKADTADLPDMTDYYNKTQTDALLADKADTSALADYATTQALTTGLAGKVDTSTLSDYYTKTATDALLAGKADTSDIPDISNLATKVELTTGLAGKVDTATLADYATTQALTTGLATKQDTLTAGDGITISSNTISATNRGSVDVVPGDDKVTVNDPDGLNSATLSVGGAGVLFDISGSEVANLASKTYVDSNKTTLVTQVAVTAGQATSATATDGDYQLSFGVAGDTVQMDFTNTDGSNTKFLATQQYVDNKTALQTTEVYDESSVATDFKPVATEYVKDGGVTYTKYRFYFRTGFLALANDTKTFDFSTLMADYTVKEWTNVAGFLDNGHKLSSGRTGNLGNVGIIQQLGRNSKQLIIRSYGDLSTRTAILQLEFYGTKS